MADHCAPVLTERDGYIIGFAFGIAQQFIAERFPDADVDDLMRRLAAHAAPAPTPDETPQRARE